MSHSKVLSGVFIGLLALCGCFQHFTKVAPRPLDPEQPPVAVTAPLKVHLTNGEVAIFPGGARFTPDSIRGAGRRYAFDVRRDTAGTPIQGLSLDGVAALETFHEQMRPVETVVATTFATLGTFVIATAAAVAIFGSCPTIYSDVLEAEAFPNSIVPLFEARDVDRLSAVPKAGVLELEVRNEALETHYINHLELLEVLHAEDALAVPDDDGGIWLLEDLAPPTEAFNRAGVNVAGIISREDDAAYETPAATISSTMPDDLVDTIDFGIDAAGADTVVAYFRLRNSLLSSVFFYEYMLDAQGANALNWMSEDLNSIGGAVQLGGFYQQHMGLRIELLENGAYREVGRVREVGPVAWDHVAVPISTEGLDSLQLRLRFIADAWRIDRVAVARQGSRARARSIPIGYVRGGDADDVRARLNGPDEQYVITNPGDRFWIGFDTEAVASGSTYFIASQGFYTEWIRGNWVRDDVYGKPFQPTVETLHAAIQRWQDVKEDFEKRFVSTRIQVR